ncbi:hypothetical protein DFH08DRAFT_810484 [Mycena albidolilacea]|uniref:Uncharacterized protein n=1 Tax=Mycena albidolilacea TaxID=1033008 RepID=A0AAD6ZZH6_9AGAR|nr:hypothetical protein DFH08DRAFT_810484 [Mycena albidolilacea]
MEGRPESQKLAVDASRPDPGSDFTIGDAVAVQYTRRWPLSVITGQVFLLAISFGFFGAVRVTGQIPLETRLVDLAQSNPQAKTFFVTFFATAISAFSSYLFTKAVQHAIRVYLTRSGSVSTLRFGILLSRRSTRLSWERREIKWVVIGGAFSLATLGQTSSWTSLITPIQIVVLTPLHGTDIDLTSDAFSSRFDDLWSGPSGIQSYINTTLSLIDTAGGIFPINLRYLVNPNWNTTALVTSSTKAFPPFGINFNMTMAQQGFTTAISTCQFQQLDAESDPPLVRTVNAFELTSGGQGTSYTAVSITTTCTNGETVQYDVVSQTNDTLLSLSCPETTDVGLPVYLCTMFPATLNMNVTYEEGFIYNELQPPDPTTADFANAPAIVSYAAFYGLDQAILHGQSLTRSLIGDSIAQIYANQDQLQAPLSYPEVWGYYITGATEFVGTAMKTELSSYNGPFGGDPPQSMTRPINGSALTTTLGWKYQQGATNAILIPSTFVAVASIVIVLLAQVLNRGIPARHADFDPTDPLVLMAAASAGGMEEMFNGLAKEDIKDGGGKKLRLAHIDDKDGFVQVSPPASTLAAPSQRGNSLWRFPSEDMKSDFRAIDAVPEESTRRWPLSVVVGQLFLLALLLGFFGAVRVRGQIPLQISLADLVQSNPQSKTAIVTLLASVLSAYSSYLFSQAIRHAIRVYLTRPIPLSTLRFGILLSRGSPIWTLERREAKWVIICVVFLLANLSQTASWSSLITPMQIVVPTPLQGTEIDLTSDAFSNQFDELWNGTSGIKDYIDSALWVLAMSGTVNANSQAGYGSFIDFGGWIHQDSTGGTFPINLPYLADPTLNTTALITSNTKPFPPPGSDFNVSMSQQGFSAVASCQYQQLDAESDPPLERFVNSVEINSDGGVTTYTAVSVTTTCTNGQIVQYGVIIDGQGVYSTGPDGESVVCTVFPGILTVNSTYAHPFIFHDVDLQTTADLQLTPAPAVVSYVAFYGLDQGILRSQSRTGNSIGDSMAKIHADQDKHRAPLDYPTFWVVSSEEYIIGVIQSVGTAMKTELSSYSGPFGGDPPESMTMAINGTAFTTTFGWEYKQRATYFILIPTPFVAVASILILLWTQIMNQGIPVRHVDFDPNDPLELMAAASAGGMGDVFRGLEKEDIREGSDKKVKLAHIEDRDGFVEVV